METVKRSNVSIKDNKLQLSFLGLDCIDMVRFLATETKQYCKELSNNPFSWSNPRDRFYLQQAKNLSMVWRLKNNSSVFVSFKKEDFMLLREAILLCIERFDVKEFLDFAPHDWVSLYASSPEEVSFLQKITDMIIDSLKKEGIVVHKRRSQSSLSHYLMLDNRVLKFVRISDHLPIKDSFKYDVVVMSQGKPEDVKVERNTKKDENLYMVVKGLPYKAIIEALIQDITEDKQCKIENMGKTIYNKMFYSNEFDYKYRGYVKA